MLCLLQSSFRRIIFLRKYLGYCWWDFLVNQSVFIAVINVCIYSAYTSFCWLGSYCYVYKVHSLTTLDTACCQLSTVQGLFSSANITDYVFVCSSLLSFIAFAKSSVKVSVTWWFCILTPKRTSPDCQASAELACLQPFHYDGICLARFSYWQLLQVVVDVVDKHSSRNFCLGGFWPKNCLHLYKTWIDSISEPVGWPCQIWWLLEESVYQISAHVAT